MDEDRRLREGARELLRRTTSPPRHDAAANEEGGDWEGMDADLLRSNARGLLRLLNEGGDEQEAADDSKGRRIAATVVRGEFSGCRTSSDPKVSRVNALLRPYDNKQRSIKTRRGMTSATAESLNSSRASGSGRAGATASMMSMMRRSRR